MDIEGFASLTPAEILELTVSVDAYQRTIAGKTVQVKQASRGGNAAAGKGPAADDKPKVDQILASKVPTQPLSKIQRYLIKQKADAYRDLVHRAAKLRGDTTDEYSLARSVLLKTADYYDKVVDPTASFDDKEKSRLSMESDRLTLKNVVREKARLQASLPPQQQPELPASW